MDRPFHLWAVTMFKVIVAICALLTKWLLMIFQANQSDKQADHYYPGDIEELADYYFKPWTAVDPSTFDQMAAFLVQPNVSRGATVVVQIFNGTRIMVDRTHFTTAYPWDKLRMHWILERIRKILLSQSGLPDMQFVLVHK